MDDNTHVDAIQSLMPNDSKQSAPKFVSEITILAEPNDVEGQIGSYVNLSARVEANNPTYQWYDKYGAQMPRMCRSNLTIGPIKEEDFGFYRMEVRDGLTNQAVLTRWAELKKAQPREIQSDMNEYQQVEPSLIRTEPLPQSSPVQEKRKIHTEYLPQHQLEQLTPVLLIQPEGGAYSRGSRITLTAHFENATHYQWCKDGVKLEGCVGNTLVINNANLENTGDYDLYASNHFGSIYSRTGVVIF